MSTIDRQATIKRLQRLKTAMRDSDDISDKIYENIDDLIGLLSKVTESNDQQIWLQGRWAGLDRLIVEKGVS